MNKLPDSWGKSRLPDGWGKKDIVLPNKSDKQADVSSDKAEDTVSISSAHHECLQEAVPAKREVVSVTESPNDKPGLSKADNSHQRDKDGADKRIPGGHTEDTSHSKTKVQRGKPKAAVIVASAIVVILILSSGIFAWLYFSDANTPLESVTESLTADTTPENSLLPSYSESTTESVTSTTLESTIQTTVSPLDNTTYTSEKHGFTVTLPAAWQKYGKIVESNDRVGFHHNSYVSDFGDGSVFSIVRIKEADYHTDLYAGHTQPIFWQDGYIYFVAYPSDVNYDYDNLSIRQEYSELKNDESELLQSLVWKNAPPGNGYLTVSDATAFIQGLIKSGQKLEMDILVGFDLPYSENDYLDMRQIRYYAVSDPDYQNIADIKSATESVYTKAYAENHLYQIFEGDSPKYIEQNGKLYVNPLGIGGGTTWHIDTLTILFQSPNMALLELDAESYGEVMPETIMIKKVNGKWLLDSKVF